MYRLSDFMFPMGTDSSSYIREAFGINEDTPFRYVHMNHEELLDGLARAVELSHEWQLMSEFIGT